MSENTYIVIFEHTAITGGFYGCRIRINYIGKEDFEATNPKTPELTIVKEGIDEEEAYKLLYSVPPICHYLAAVEEAFKNPDTRFIPQHLKMNLCQIIPMIDRDREYLRNQMLFANPVDEALMAHIRKLTGKTTAKSTVMKLIIMLYDFDINDLNPLSRGTSFLNAIERSCRDALKLFPKD